MGKLSFAILLKTFQKLGYLPKIESVPKQIKAHIAAKLRLKAVKSKLRNYLEVKSYGNGGADIVREIIQQTALTMSDPAERIRAKAEKATLRRAEEELKVERRQVREHRFQEDSAWQSERAERRRQQEVRESQQIAGVKLPHGSKKARDEVWRHKRQRRR